MGFDNQTCDRCNFVYPCGKTICPSCGHDPNCYPMGYDRYNKTPSQHLENVPKVVVGEPYMVNPNNESHASEVLDHMRMTCNIPDDLSWTVIWADAIPYLYGFKNTTQYLVRCNTCNERLDLRKITFNEHVQGCVMTLFS